MTQFGILWVYEVCTVSSCLQHPIPSKVLYRSTKKIGRVSVDLGGPTDVATLCRKQYTALFRDNLSRFMRFSFLHHKDDVAKALERLLVEPRRDGKPGTIRPDVPDDFKVAPPSWVTVTESSVRW